MGDLAYAIVHDGLLGTDRYHELEVTMTDPKTLPESDPRRHTMQIRSRLTELTEHLREDVQKVEDPSFKALFETTAEVLTGLEKAIGGYEEKSGNAWS